MDIKKNEKYFNSYVFLTTFSRNLIEVFIGTILYKIGFSFKEVIFYYLLVNLFSCILAPGCIRFSKKYSNKTLSLIGVVSFFLLQLTLNILKKKTYFLYLTAFLFALYRRGYWIPRKYYMFQVVVDKKNISNKYTIISIINQLGVIIAGYVGSILLEFFSIKFITIISFFLLGLGISFLYKLDIPFEKNDYKLNLKECFRSISKRTVISYSMYECQNVVKFLFALYIIIYVKDTYTAVGLVYLIANIASLLFSYLYGRFINNSKRSLFRFSFLLFILIKVFEINVVGVTLMIASFIEGLTARMLELSLHKEYISLSKYFEFYNYNYFFEMVQDIGRFILVSILYLFFKDVKVMLYVSFIYMFIAVILGMNSKPIVKDSSVIWHEE